MSYLLDYGKVTDYILNLRRFGEMKPGLERIRYLLNELGNPQKKLKYVHIGGTAGKGSTAAMLSSVLSSEGYKVGTFTSPHLSDYTERIVVRGKKIPKDDVARLFDEIIPIAEKMKETINDTPTFFEFTTALALKYFYEREVDIAVVEVGLGGRLDATNVINPIVSVITNIALEHTDTLGDTKAKIAYEKAGIIKKQRSLVTACDPEVYGIFKERCKELDSEIYCVGTDIKVKALSSDCNHQIFDVSGFGKSYREVECKLIGNHQLLNAGCAFGAVNILNQNGFTVSEDAFRKGLKDVVWPGRLEIMQKEPTVLLDAAKDELAMKALRSAITGIFKYRKITMIIGISADKEITPMLNEIIPISDSVIVTKHHVAGRALDPEALAAMVSKYGKTAIVAKGVDEAINLALKSCSKDDLVCITGSVFLVGEARERWHKEVVIWGREMNETRGIPEEKR